MCTSFKLRPAEDGTVCVGRTMEFPDLIPWSLSVLPAGSQLTASVPDAPRAWTSAHAVVGICGFDNTQWIVDGMNTAGVSAHALYMPGFCHYAAPATEPVNLAAVDVIGFLLGTCASVAEARAAIEGCSVVAFDPGMGFAPPLHFAVHDATASIVIEFRPDGMSVVDDPVGVMTNSPYLDWHLLNLRQYVGLSAWNPTATVDGAEVGPLGNGGGLRGLPGDYTPPGRFVRAFAMRELIDAPADAATAERTALQILNSFEIPSGIIRETMPDGTTADEVTTWSTIANLTAGRFAYRSIRDPRVYVVDFATADLATARTHPLESTWTFEASGL
jgi:choloylglycine hydrolase